MEHAEAFWKISDASCTCVPLWWMVAWSDETKWNENTKLACAHISEVSHAYCAQQYEQHILSLPMQRKCVLL